MMQFQKASCFTYTHKKNTLYSNNLLLMFSSVFLLCYDEVSASLGFGLLPLRCGTSSDNLKVFPYL